METLLIRKAKDLGREVVPGIDMFIEQAVQQFETWTNESAPRSVMQKAALEALGQAVTLSP
jgi:shikimate 5-dehydrogenase